MLRQLGIFAAIALIFTSCRTTKQDGDRYFAPGKNSKDGVIGHSHTGSPRPPTSKPLPPLIPDTNLPVKDGVFYVICAAQNQLPAPQSLTVQVIRAATHSRDCEAAEIWLRKGQNRSIQLDSAELVELQTLSVLASFPNIIDVYLRAAKGIDRVCPLQAPQICHFIESNYE